MITNRPLEPLQLPEGIRKARSLSLLVPTFRVVDAGFLINIGLLVVATIAAGFAGWQALTAKRARDDARAASREAGEQARASAEAAQRAAAAAEALTAEQRRAADALERRADLAERLATPPRVWELHRVSGDAIHDQRWEARNVSPDLLSDVHIETPDGYDEQWIQPEAPGVAVDVGPGESLYFTFRRRLGSPTTRVVRVMWTSPSGVPQLTYSETITAD